MHDAFVTTRFGRIVSWLQVGFIVLAMVLPALVINSRVNAAQVEQRSIDISTSEANATGVTYSVSFDTATTSNLNGLVVQFCSDSPIIGETCSTAAGDVPDMGATPTVTNQSGATFTVDGANSDGDTLVLTGTNTSVPSGTTVSFDITGVTNPDTPNVSFYGRIVTYATAAGAQSYAAGTPGTHVDDGGIAMSTAEQITVTARVQERLEFCVGDSDANASNDCSDISGNDVDLGVLTPGAANYASVNPIDDTQIGHARLSTNAFNGAAIQYYATELQVSGATCSGTTTTDQCINEKTTAAANIAASASTEEWGMAVTSVIDDGATTGQELTVASNYDNQYHMTTLASTSLASSSSIVDNEQLEIDFGATPHTTTPTGVYSSTLTFVATGTF